ncbi:MAG: SH3 domain-containing protein [Anaerolineaceae bacterium]|nr:SH3 domain-containing protein [Anaerolineaceae bacterium]
MNEDLRIRAVAFSITSRFEGGSYQTCQTDDAGILSYGRFQFTLASGVLARVVDQYLDNSPSQIAASLKAYRSRIASRDARLRHESRLHDLLVAAGREPEMRQIQDDEARKNFWDPTLRVAIQPRNLKTPLAHALLFDISINFGMGDGFLRMAEREFDVPERSRIDQNGLGESRLITRVAELRKLSHDRQAARDNLPGLRQRGDFWLNLVHAGDWQLHGDDKGEIQVRSKSLQVRAPDLSAGDSAPGLDPDKFYVAPSEYRVRIREQPETGITLTMTGLGDVLESLEPHDATRDKVDNDHAWLHIRSLDGVEGYVSCMFLNVHQDPDPRQFLPPAPPQNTGPNIMTPHAAPVPAPLLVTPVEDRIRVRAQPEDGEMLDSISRGDVAEVLESRDSALGKLGVQDAWLRVRTTGGTEGYSAAWYLALHEADESPSTSSPGGNSTSGPKLARASASDNLPAASHVRGAIPEVQLFVSPTIHQVQVWSRPLEGEQIAVLEQNEVAAALEDPDAALAKVGRGGEWLYVRTPRGVDGYCDAGFLGVFDGSSPAPALARSQGSEFPFDAPVYVTPTEDRIRVRVQPVDGEPIGTLSKGDVVEVIDSPPQALEKIGVQDEWLHIRTPSGTEGFTAAWFYALAESPEPPRLYVTPESERIRIRSAPVDGDPLAIVRPGDVLMVLDPYEEALSRIGREGEWLYVQSRDDVEGYTQAEHYIVVDKPQPIVGDNITGVNLDRYHRLGTPNPGRLGNMGWVRFNYNVSLNPVLPYGNPERYGNRDIVKTYERFGPVINAYIDAGYKAIVVLAHQTYGEGTSDVWHRMDTRRWNLLSDRLAEMAAKIATQYKGRGIVWQIWNEMDAHTGHRASVPLPPADYGRMLSKCITAIREADPEAMVITGGHCSGPHSGPDYARQTLEAMPRDLRPDGIAFHPYGRGPAFAAGKYRHFGLIDESLDAWARVMPGKPVWITEFGVLNADEEPVEDISKYASDFVTYLKQRYEGRVVTAIWYAWGHGMDNGFGLVDRDDLARDGFTDVFINL